MPFKIAPFPARPDKRSYAGHEDIRLYLGIPHVELRSRYGDYPYWAVRKMPMDFTGTAEVPLMGRHEGKTTLLVCKAGSPSKTGDWRGKRSTHRCFVKCPDCSAMVPAGRTQQHKCKDIPA